MPPVEQPMITMGMVEPEQPLTDSAPIPEAAMPSDTTSDATQIVLPEEVAQPGPPVEVDRVLLTGQGREWYREWKEDVIDDDMVRQRWGEAVVELFHATLSMELAVRSPSQEASGHGGARAADVSDLESDEEKRAREIAEGAVDDRPGYVELVAGSRDDSLQGQENHDHGMGSETLVDDSMSMKTSCRGTWLDCGPPGT